MFSHALATIIHLLYICWLNFLREAELFIFAHHHQPFHPPTPPSYASSAIHLFFLLKKLTYHLSAPSLHEKSCPTLSYPTFSTFDFIHNPAFGTSSRTPVIHIHPHSHSLRAHWHSLPYFRFGRPAPLYFLVRPAGKVVSNVCAHHLSNRSSPA